MRFSSPLILIVVTLLFLCSAVVSKLQISAGPSDFTTSNWITGTFPCSAEHPCTPTDHTFIIQYTIPSVSTITNVSFNLTIYTQTKSEEIFHSESIQMEKSDGIFTHPAQKVFLTTITSPVVYIVELTRSIKDPQPAVSNVSITIGSEIDTGSLVDANNSLISVYNQEVRPSARFILGPDVPQDSQDSGTPYDNFVLIDFDLGWNDWDKFHYDRIIITPSGFGFLQPDEYEYECLFAGQMISDVRVFAPDDAFPNLLVLELANLLEITSRNQATFGTPTQLQLQCAFSLPPNPFNQIRTLHLGYSLEFDNQPPTPHPENNKPQFNEEQKDKPMLFYALDDPESPSQLHLITVEANIYSDSIGSIRSTAIQSRFVEVRDRSLPNISNINFSKFLSSALEVTAAIKNRYMSYYYVSFPYEMSQTAHAIKSIVGDLKRWENLSIYFTGLEVSHEDSIEYVHFFVQCHHQSSHFTITRTHTALYGSFNVNDAQKLIGPEKKQIHVSNPSIRLGSTLPWQTQEEFDIRPMCDQWSLDLAVGIYSENINPKEWEETDENAFSIRLSQPFLNSTLSIIHDWVSAYDHESLETSNAEGHTNQFLITNLIKHDVKDTLPYYSFDMIVDTTGIMPPTDPQHTPLQDDQHTTASFSLDTLSGNLRFLLPLKKSPDGGDDDLIDPIECTLSYYNSEEKKDITTTISTYFLNDLSIPFELIEPPYNIGMPYNTKNIKIQCTGLFLQQLTEDAPLDKDHTNLAIILADITLVGSVFGPSFSPEQHNRMSWGKAFGIFLLWLLLIIALFVLILFIINWLTKGAVVTFWKTRIRPCLAYHCPCFALCGITTSTEAPSPQRFNNGGETKGTGLDDIDVGPTGGYGSLN